MRTCDGCGREVTHFAFTPSGLLLGTDCCYGQAEQDESRRYIQDGQWLLDLMNEDLRLIEELLEGRRR